MYDEEEIRRWEEEGGGFLIKNGIIDTDDLEEIEAYKREIKEEEEIKKINNEGKRSFDIVKLKERSVKKMSYYEYADSADNDDDRELLIDEIRDFYNDEEIEGLEKVLKVLPKKLREALKESFKILNEYKSEMEGIPDLLSAVKLLGRLATGKPGKEPYPYPYPKKVQKSMDWSEVQDMLFGGHIGPAGDEEIEKSSKSNPFPSITRALKIKKQAIDELEEELEEENFDPDSRRI